MRNDRHTKQIFGFCVVLTIVLILFVVALKCAALEGLSPEKERAYTEIAKYYTVREGVLTEIRTEATEEPTTAAAEPETESVTEPETLPTETEAEPTEAETVPATIPETVPETEPVRTFKDKCSDIAQSFGADHEIFCYLYDALDAQGIAWWTPYAIAQIFQESRWNPMAENKNGLDKGLLQYRITYWNAETMGDIFDYRAQINRYVGQTANRLRAGCSIEETISRHMMSDWGEFNAKYVNDVMRWYREVE